MKYNNLKQLSFGLRQLGGRTRYGPITSPRRGTSVKQLYRFLDTKRTSSMRINGGLILRHYLYDPHRTAFISLISTINAITTYILATDYPTSQKRIYNLQEAPIKKDKGWSQLLKNFPSGTILNNIELYPGNGGQIARAAGNSAVLLKKETKKKRVILRLKSGELRLISEKCIGVSGVISNQKHFLRNYKKAGTIRCFGIRPRVRPSSMNPVDHPMGGRTRGGCAPKNKNGKLNKKNKKKNNFKIAYLIIFFIICFFNGFNKKHIIIIIAIGSIYLTPNLSLCDLPTVVEEIEAENLSWYEYIYKHRYKILIGSLLLCGAIYIYNYGLIDFIHEDMANNEKKATNEPVSPSINNEKKSFFSNEKLSIAKIKEDLQYNYVTNSLKKDAVLETNIFQQKLNKRDHYSFFYNENDSFFAATKYPSFYNFPFTKEDLIDYLKENSIGFEMTLFEVIIDGEKTSLSIFAVNEELYSHFSLEEKTEWFNTWFYNLEYIHQQQIIYQYTD